MTPKISLTLFLFFLSICTFSQNISAKELTQYLYYDEGQINEKLNNKNWAYNNATPADASHYKVVTWTYKDSPNGAQQYFFLNVPTEAQKESSPFTATNCTYTFANSTIYQKLKKDLVALGYKKGSTHTKETSIIETYYKEDQIGFRISSSSASGVTSYNVSVYQYKTYLYHETKEITSGN